MSTDNQKRNLRNYPRQFLSPILDGPVWLQNLLAELIQRIEALWIDPDPPGQVDGVTVTPNNLGNQVQWNRALKAKGYQAFRNTSGNIATATLFRELPGNDNTSFFDPNDETTPTRFYWIRGVNAKGDPGPLSSMASGTNFYVDPTGTAMGVDAIASGSYSTSLGYNSQATSTGATAMGVSAIAAGSGGTALGFNAVSGTGANNVAVGASPSGGTGDNNVIVGAGTVITGNLSNIVAVGQSIAVSVGDSQTLVGQDATGTAARGTAIGHAASVASTDGLAIGDSAQTGSGANGVMVGANTSNGSGANNTIVGNNSSIVTGLGESVIVGQGTAITTGSHQTIVGQGGTGSAVRGTGLGRGVVVSATDSTAIGDSAAGAGVNAAVVGAQAFSGTGSDNTVMGFQAGVANTIGESVAIGASASIATGSHQTIVGQGGVGSAVRGTGVGHDVSVSGTDGTALGDSAATGSGTSNTVVGSAALSGSASNNTAIGASASSTGGSATALGQSASASGASATIVGQGSSSGTGSSNTVIGQGSSIGSGLGNSVIAGQGTAITTGSHQTAVGQGITASAVRGTAVGHAASVTGTDGTVIGDSATTGTGTNNTVAGSGATTGTLNSSSNTAIGASATGTGGAATVVGQGSIASASNTTVVGQGSSVSGARSTSVGQGNTVTHSDVVVVGNAITSTSGGQVILGSATTNFGEIWLGRGVTHSSTAQTTEIHATDGSGTNINGDHLALYAGAATGNGSGGRFEVYRAIGSSTSGTTLQSHAVVMQIKSDGTVVYTGTGAIPSYPDGNLLVLGPSPGSDARSGFACVNKTDGNHNGVSMFVSQDLNYAAITSFRLGTATHLPLTIWTQDPGTTDPIIKGAEFGDGMTLNNASGTRPSSDFMGFGTLNVATNVYKNGTAYNNPDFVFEHYYTGTIEKFIENEGAKEYEGLKPLEELEAMVKQTLRLPHMKGNHGIFDGGEAVQLCLEELYLHVFRLNDRVKELEALLEKKGQ